MLGSAESEMVRLINREIISQNCNLYDHDTSALQTDGRMDKQLALAIPRSARLRAVKIMLSPTDTILRPFRIFPRQAFRV